MALSPSVLCFCEVTDMKRTASVKRYDNFSKEGTEFLLGFLDSSQNWQYIDGGNLHVDIFGESDDLGED